MRARNLKPGFFKNELLGSADPLIGILFQGLWCQADREGRLEDRPLRLCAELFPYRRSVTEKKVDQWLVWLQSKNFIHRYEVDGIRYIQVIEFKKHQNPHAKERPSLIPALNSISPSAKHPPSTRRGTNPAQGKDGKRHDATLLNPHSLIPDSPFSHTHDPEPGASTGSEPDPDKPLDPIPKPLDVHLLDEEQHHARFERIVEIFPDNGGRRNLLVAEHHCRLKVERGQATWDELEAAAEHYRRYVEQGGVSSAQYALSIVNFYGAADDPWKRPWTPPAPKPNGNGKAAVRAKTAVELEDEIIVAAIRAGRSDAEIAALDDLVVAPDLPARIRSKRQEVQRAEH